MQLFSINIKLRLLMKTLYVYVHVEYDNVHVDGGNNLSALHFYFRSIKLVRITVGLVSILLGKFC